MMLGLAFTSIALGLTAAAAAASVGASAYQGHQQRKQARGAALQQMEAQRLATSRAAAEARRQEQQNRELNRKGPNLGSLLGAERRRGSSGPGATTLTGAAGVSAERLTLGRSSLLGAT